MNTDHICTIGVIHSGRHHSPHIRKLSLDHDSGGKKGVSTSVADHSTALVVTAEGASCAARAVPSDRVSCVLAARRVPTDRFTDGVPGAGQEPSASP